MATPQSKVLALAAREIGYSRWNDPKSGTKYARETQPVFWPKDTWLTANGISFCDIFITWVFWKAFGKQGSINVLPAQPSYNTDYRASKGGRITKANARPGDVLVFDWNWNTRATNHVGILEKRLSSGNFQTIEGNTSAGTVGSQSNGGRVARRTRKQSQVRYVIRPRWNRAAGTTGAATEPWKASPRIQGMSKAEVKRIQQMLVDANNSIGKSGVDGSYGKDTYNTVKRVQKALGLTADGVFGPATEKALAAHLKTMGKKVPAKPKAPAFPLDRKPGWMFYFGPASGPITSISGKNANSRAKSDVVKDKNGRWYSKGLKVWQKAAGIADDGRYGPETERTVKAMQKKAGVKVDGKIGPDTWKLAFA